MFPKSRHSQALRKLLVIEDDPKLLASYCDLLTPYGFEILTAENGQSAIPIVQSNPEIQLVILDLMMPVMDGIEWLRWFRTTERDWPVIIITGQPTSRIDPELQPTFILKKPFHVAELLDIVGLFCGLGTPTTSERGSNS